MTDQPQAAETGSIWQDDRLGREEDAQFLIDYVLERNARMATDRGLAINLNAGWGFGKTFFLHHLKQKLEADGFSVAMVDAWRDDHADDPLFAVISSVLGAFDSSEKERAGIVDRLKRDAGKLTVRMARGAVTRGLEVAFGKENAEGIADDVGRIFAGAMDDIAGEYAKVALASFDKGREAITDFREGVNALVETLPRKPLFVFIDELDRCRPTYAVALLERLKHLFDMPNVVFIVATDTGQLVHTIRNVYGAEFDAQRYLLRFFERSYSFGEPPLEAFVTETWNRIGLDEKRFGTLADNSVELEISVCSRAMNLSLRDVEQCMELLFSLSIVSDNRVELPLIYCYVMCCAYQCFTDDFAKMTQNKYQITNDLNIYSLLASEKIYCGMIYSDNRTGQRLYQNILEIYRRFAGSVRKPFPEAMRYGPEWVSPFFRREMETLYKAGLKAGSTYSILKDVPDMLRRAARMGDLGTESK